MVHWPKTVGGYVLGLLLAVVVVATVVQASIALSGPFIWGALIVTAVTSIVAVVWYRRAQAASDLALADAPSFADVLPHWNDHSDRVPNASGS
jgi:UDP-N-acetylmuramyl pentapeptide phosphotransferase/UDP-N-acetylglucosamine-1-phosphate transferase